MHGYELCFAEHGDLAEIVEIYNHDVLNAHFTFDIETFSVDTHNV